MMPYRSVTQMRNNWYFTHILDRFTPPASIDELSTYQLAGPIRTMVYKITSGADTFALKTMHCSMTDTESVARLKAHRDFPEEITAVSGCFSVPIDVQTCEDPAAGRFRAELLYDYNGEALDVYYRAKKADMKDAKQILALARKILEPMAVLETNGVYHLDLRPSDVLIRADGTVKIFRLALESSQNYAPPEVLCMGGYVREKVDIYSWGMIMYQLVTGESEYQLRLEADTFKRPGKMLDYAGFRGNVRGIKLDGDGKSPAAQLVVQLLDQALSFDPLRRPTFAGLRAAIGGDAPAEKMEKAAEEVKTVEEEPRNEETKELGGEYERICSLFVTLKRETREIVQEYFAAEERAKVGINS